MKTYIGDGIYAEITGDELIVTTSDGLRDTNTIVFGAAEWTTLTQWVHHLTHVKAARPPFTEQAHNGKP